MQTVIFGLFLILHGLVHLLYVGQSRRLFQIPNLSWPDESWLFARFLSVPAARWVAVVLLGLATLAFVGGGVGVLARQGWGGAVALGAAALSSAIYILFWNGKWKSLSEQGIIAILINLAVAALIQVFGWAA